MREITPNKSLLVNRTRGFENKLPRQIRRRAVDLSLMVVWWLWSLYKKGVPKVPWSCPMDDCDVDIFIYVFFF